jgi:hypothetical protein
MILESVINICFNATLLSKTQYSLLGLLITLVKKFQFNLVVMFVFLVNQSTVIKLILMEQLILL